MMRSMIVALSHNAEWAACCSKAQARPSLACRGWHDLSTLPGCQQGMALLGCATGFASSVVVASVHNALTLRAAALATLADCSGISTGCAGKRQGRNCMHWHEHLRPQSFAAEGLCIHSLPSAPTTNTEQRTCQAVPSCEHARNLLRRHTNA